MTMFVKTDLMTFVLMLKSAGVDHKLDRTGIICGEKCGWLDTSVYIDHGIAVWFDFDADGIFQGVRQEG
jgi:hypothetical protein